MGNTQFTDEANPNPQSDSSTHLDDECDYHPSLNEGRQSYSPPSQPNEIVCEGCQECSPPFLQERQSRICPRNSSNSQSGPTSHARRAPKKISKAPELEKSLCEFCNELCIAKYQDNHKRVCRKNPENIKIVCNHCRQTLNFLTYVSHLEACEDAHSSNRRRSLEPEHRGGRALGSPLGNLRKIRTDNEINLDALHKTKRHTPNKDIECSICLEAIKPNYDGTKLKCNHKFHQDCLDRWSMRQRRCPLCRKGYL